MFALSNLPLSHRYHPSDSVLRYTGHVATLTIATLGSFVVKLDEEDVTNFRSRKNQMLLAYLAVEAERVHQRTSIAGLFWPDQEERAAALNLRQSLFRLRKRLGKNDPPFLDTTRRSVRLDPASDFQLDVTVFSRELEVSVAHEHESRQTCTACVAHLERAVTLYRGDFLEGFFFDNNVGLEEWILLNREWLRRQMLLALDDLTSFHTHNNNFDQAHTYAFRQLTIDPLRESVHQQLIKLYAEAGQRDAALQQYETCRQVLWDELGVEPAAETTALLQQLTRQRSNQSALPQSSLPSHQTGFFGREREAKQLSEALSDDNTRVVTLVGMGGVGKTRLALQVAQQLTSEYGDGVWFVPLDNITVAKTEQLSALVTTIAGVLHLRFQEHRDTLKQLAHHLQSRHGILILDNAEHIDMPTLRHLIDVIVNAAPTLRLLLTSRVRLRWHGERILRLDGLPVPPIGEAADIRAYASVQLFCERARWISADFRPTNKNIAAIAQICRLLDGLPLGIELAATWVEHFGCDEIVAELMQDADFLEANDERVERHHSLRALFDYSWQLLSKNEQHLLANLSVLKGEFNRSAALAIGDERLPTLVRLSEKSLLRVVAPGRYTLHEVIRHYAGLALADYGEAVVAKTRQRYARYFLGWVAQHAPSLFGDSPQTGIEAIRANFEHVRQAWQWAVNDKSWGVMQQAAGGIGRFCRLTGYLNEARHLFSDAIAALNRLESVTRNSDTLLAELLIDQGEILLAQEQHTETLALAQQLREFANDPSLIATGHLYQGWTYWHQWQLDKAQSELEQAKTLTAHAPRQATLQAEIIRATGLVAYRQGDYTTARRHLEQALTLHQLAIDPQRTSQILRNLGAVARNLHDYEAATDFYEQSLRYSNTIGDRWTESIVLNNLGDIAYYSGEFDRAHTAYQNSLEVARDVGNQLGEGIALNNLGIFYRAIGLFDQAGTTLNEAVQINRRNGFERGVGWSLASLSLLYTLRGQPVAATTYCERAWSLFETLDDREGLLFALLYRGHAQLEAGEWQKANEAYQQVIQLAEQAGRDHFLPEAYAGLAKADYLAGEMTEALEVCERLLPYLNGRAVYGCHRPIWLYWVCYQVLSDSADSRAETILQHAHTLLQRRLNSLADTNHRRQLTTSFSHLRSLLKLSSRENSY